MTRRLLLDRAPIYLNWGNRRRRRGECAEPANTPWSLGRWSAAFNVVAILWVTFIAVVFVLPPNELVLWTMLAVAFALDAYWRLSAHRFVGPMTTTLPASPSAQSPSHFIIRQSVVRSMPSARAAAALLGKQVAWRILDDRPLDWTPVPRLMNHFHNDERASGGIVLAAGRGMETIRSGPRSPALFVALKPPVGAPAALGRLRDEVAEARVMG